MKLLWLWSSVSVDHVIVFLQCRCAAARVRRSTRTRRPSPAGASSWDAFPVRCAERWRPRRPSTGSSRREERTTSFTWVFETVSWRRLITWWWKTLSSSTKQQFIWYKLNIFQLIFQAHIQTMSKQVWVCFSEGL